jgi:riboflavin synthase
MFTGIVEVLASVEALGRRGAGWRLVVRLPDGLGWGLGEGESVAVNGACLTVVEPGGNRLAFDLAEETVRVTTLGDLAPGDPVNLERALRLDGRLHGHLVLGHVDGVGCVSAIRPEGEGRRVSIEVPAALGPFLIPKGSVTVDGVSLTMAEIGEAGFSVALIPHTLAVTTLGTRGTGARVNLEMDVIGKYVRAFLQHGAAPGDATRIAARSEPAGAGAEGMAAAAARMQEG